MGTVVAIKENGKPQRSDILLDKDIVATLLQRIFAGQTLFPPEGYIFIEREGQEPQKLKTKTIQKWVERNNVIPETGYTLRDVLDKAREEKRSKEREARQKAMVDEAERAMHRTVRLNTNLPVVGMFGVVKDENGKIIRKENAALLKVKMDTTQFVLERLNPERYGKVEKTENKHLLFSLSDLRKARDEMAQSRQK